MDVGGDPLRRLIREGAEFHPRVIDDAPLVPRHRDEVADEGPDRSGHHREGATLDLQGKQVQFPHPHPIRVGEKDAGATDVKEGHIPELEFG